MILPAGINWGKSATRDSTYWNLCGQTHIGDLEVVGWSFWQMTNQHSIWHCQGCHTQQINIPLSTYHLPLSTYYLTLSLCHLKLSTHHLTLSCNASEHTIRHSQYIIWHCQICHAKHFENFGIDYCKQFTLKHFDCSWKPVKLMPSSAKFTTQCTFEYSTGKSME